MTTGQGWRVRLAAVGIAVLAALAVALPNGFRAAAQDKKDAPAGGVCDYLGKGPTPATAGDLSAGIAGCQACHNGADKGLAAGYVKNFKANEFVLLSESDTWIKDDIHSRALATLDGPLGQSMEKALAAGNKNYKVNEDVRCLTCHSADLSPTKPLAEKKYADFATAAGGVNCTVCHGLHQNWQIDHTKEPNQKGLPMPWRAKTPEYKWSRGMADLRNPVVKAMLCASCHVGNPAEGKEVTHDMYAAGHPPLPPFELASFMEGEPKHWAYPTDARMKYFESVPAEDRWGLFHFHPAKDESYLSRHYAVGAIAAMRAEASLLHAGAEKAVKGEDVIDFARFDCYSCHHDLKYPSDRQNRGYDGPPGRPPLRAAVGVPAAVVAKHAEGVEAGGLKVKATGFDEKWAALRKAATDRPFGHPAKVRDSAKAVMDWCDGFLKVQCDAPVPLYTAEQASRLRSMVAVAATGPAVADPEAAMCLAWGYATLTREANPNFPMAKLDALGKVIPVNVRTEPYSLKDKDGVTEPVPAQFVPRMKAINAFESVRFADAFRGLIDK